MLQFNFYTIIENQPTPPATTIEIGEDTYQRLAEKGFGKIGVSEQKQLIIDDELVTVSVVSLTPNVVRLFVAILLSEITETEENWTGIGTQLFKLFTSNDYTHVQL